MMSLSSPTFLPLAPPLYLHRTLSPLSISKPSILLSLSKPCICFSSSPSSNTDREESLWLREEQRWIREEQRWLREEQRWLRERHALLNEIESLKLQIQALQSRISLQGTDTVPEMIANVGALLQALKEKNQIAESGVSVSSIMLKKEEEEEEKVKEDEEEEKVIGVLEREEKEVKTTRRALRKGSEGEEVREMQEALQKLGFYSGEEDMEFSSFSSGTERAVKTWQATLGAPEDGIMTTELLGRLCMEQQLKSSRLKVGVDQEGVAQTVSQKEGGNGAAAASITQISEFQTKVVKDESVGKVEASEQRVFLLGENRWEEPSRLVGRDKQVSKSGTKITTTHCISCRGEGRLMCSECDGTGEPNIEPQFLEWIDEDTKCPYCEGLGYITCDVCEGKTMV